MLTASQLKILCEKFGLSPSKQYGQNFLISDKPILAMIDASKLNESDTIVEIGPGFGILTLAVAPLVKKVVAFEIERKLEGYWEEKKAEFRNIEIVWGDALDKFKIQSSKFKERYKVMANLPYSITSSVLRVILEVENKPEVILVMVQKEVAERICAKKGEMSLLAVSVQYYGEPKIVMKVSAGCFWPMPKVGSAVLSITPSHHHTITPPPDIFFKFVKAGFANKRKQLWRNLASGLSLDSEKVKSVLLEVMGNEKVRAEDLGVEEWKIVVEELNIFKTSD